MILGKTILVVDDDACIRRPLEFMLREEGYAAFTAANGDECLRRLEEILPDLILLDVMLPGTDGFRVCESLKRNPRWAHVPILLLSARGREGDRDLGLEAGASEFMVKPYSPSELLRRVRELLSENGDLARETKGDSCRR